jgi:hypothetical protein
MQTFIDDDAGFLEWTELHPNGFVLNLRKKDQPDSSYVVLHRASCKSITSLKRTPGAYTSRAYRKVCAETLHELRGVARREGRRDGSFSAICRICSPE